MNETGPYVGQIVSYYPSNGQRLAAIVTEVKPSEKFLRPIIDCAIFESGVEHQQGIDIEPVEDDGSSLQELAERWSFAHEYALHGDKQDSEDSSNPLPGTESNEYVGLIQQ